MFQRSRNWISEAVWKPKYPHSLEKLKYVYFLDGFINDEM